MKTLAYTSAGGCLISICTGEQHDDAEWEHYLEFVSLQGKVQKLKFFVVVDGDGLTFAQRERFFKVLEPYVNEIQGAVFSSSKKAIGNITALSWFVPGIKSFPMYDIARAFEYLNVPPTSQKLVLEALCQIKKDLGVKIGIGPLAF